MKRRNFLLGLFSSAIAGLGCAFRPKPNVEITCIASDGREFVLDFVPREIIIRHNQGLNFPGKPILVRFFNGVMFKGDESCQHAMTIISEPDNPENYGLGLNVIGINGGKFVHRIPGIE